MPNKDADVRTLQVKDRLGTFRVTIPADWKVTFGAFQSGKFGGEGSALRIYEAENKQRACFIGVISFFDTSLPIEREIVTEEGESSWIDGQDYSENVTKVNRKREVVPYS